MRKFHRKAVGARAQRGATLIVALIIFALITLLGINAFMLSTSNLKAVNNMQIRDEAIASANQAIERVISAPFYNALGTQTFDVDINKDGTNDFKVVASKPSCVKASKASIGYPSDVELGKTMSSGATWNVDWDIAATVTDSATGASVKVYQGIRALLSQIEKETTCP
jgi:Tfp pilus assembly protein PilX